MIFFPCDICASRVQLSKFSKCTFRRCHYQLEVFHFQLSQILYGPVEDDSEVELDERPHHVKVFVDPLPHDVGQRLHQRPDIETNSYVIVLKYLTLSYEMLIINMLKIA